MFLIFGCNLHFKNKPLNWSISRTRTVPNKRLVEGSKKIREGDCEAAKAGGDWLTLVDH